MTEKRTYTYYLDFEKDLYIYAYDKNICTWVFDVGEWASAEITSRYAAEVDIPDTAVLLFTGSIPK
jgi:hypothetical protein